MDLRGLEGRVRQAVARDRRCRGRISRRRWSIYLAVVLMPSLLLRCDPVGLLAPAGATISAVASPAILPTGDSAQITAIAVDSAGRPVRDSTRLLFIADAGSLCVPELASIYRGERCADTAGQPRVTVWSETLDGVTKVRYRAAGAVGMVHVQIRSGAVISGVALKVSTLAAPPGSALLLSAVPDSIAAHGDSAALVLFASSGGDAVQDATVITLTASSGTLSAAAVLTTSGYASAMYHSDGAAGAVILRARSGVVSDSVVIVVR